mmetsp:Transcript_95204/g.252867  ORF Transcript_95204/g.252867 Transcript_95204/m.252867 type:complete len:152 (+) Transcript_95204:445-900(+)
MSAVHGQEPGDPHMIVFVSGDSLASFDPFFDSVLDPCLRRDEAGLRGASSEAAICGDAGEDSVRVGGDCGDTHCEEDREGTVWTSASSVSSTITGSGKYGASARLPSSITQGILWLSKATTKDFMPFWSMQLLTRSSFISDGGPLDITSAS